MIENWDAAFEHVINHEGGFTDDERDAGNKLPDGRKGCTMWGCTQANWEAYIGKKITHDDMRALKKEDVKPLYKKNYWDAIRGDVMPKGIDYLLFDFAINAGATQSKKLLQKAVGATPDGIIGSGTLREMQNISEAELIIRFSEEKEKFYKSLSSFPTYGKGWLRRVAQVKTISEGMIV